MAVTWHKVRWMIWEGMLVTIFGSRKYTKTRDHTNKNLEVEKRKLKIWKLKNDLICIVDLGTVKKLVVTKTTFK